MAGAWVGLRAWLLYCESNCCAETRKKLGSSVQVPAFIQGGVSSRAHRWFFNGARAGIRAQTGKSLIPGKRPLKQ